ncbi:MAG: hypothetical protein H7232_19545 [Aeromicrobium sp.]|nr:hypothetical protein [Burkholderiales bacterium]
MNRVVLAFIVLLTLLVLGFVGHSLSQLEWSSAVRFSSGGGRRFAYFLLGSVSCALALLRFTRLNFLSVALLLTVGLGAATGGIWPLLVVFLVWAASRVLGEQVIKFLCSEPTQDGTVYFLVGAGILATLIGVAAHFPINYPAFYVGLLALVLFVGRQYTMRLARELLAAVQKPKAQAEARGRRLLLHSVILALGMIYLMTAYMPEVGHDALAMHLFIPRFIANQGLWTFDASTYVWALMPALGDWLYTLAYVLGGESASRLINVLFILSVALLIVRIVQWAGGNWIASCWGAIFFLAAPLTFTEGSSLFIESIWGAYIVAGCWLVLRSTVEDKPSPAYLLLAGIVLGLAASAKAVTFTVLPLLLLILVLRPQYWLRTSHARCVAVGLACFVALGCVPYVTAWAMTGNPLFPFYNGIFKSALYPVENFVDSRFLRGFSWKTPWDITLNTGKYLESFPGGAGFHWLVLILPTLIVLYWTRHRRAVALLVIGFLSIIVCFQAMAYLRYVFPATALLTAGIGVALGIILSTKGLLARIFETIVVALLGLNLVFITNASPYFDFPLKSAFMARDRADSIREMYPTRAAVELAGHINGNERPIAVFAAAAGAGARGDVLYANWYNRKFLSEVENAPTATAIASVLSERGVNLVVVDNEYRTVKTDVLNRLNEVSMELANFGTVSVRKLKSDFQYARELLINPSYAGDQAGWSMADVKRQDSGILVSTLTPASQAVPVIAGRTYRNSVVAKCASTETKGRLQIRWLDANAKQLKVDISLFDCMPEATENAAEVTAPAGATVAEIWAAGHTDKPVLFLKSSFRN